MKENVKERKRESECMTRSEKYGIKSTRLFLQCLLVFMLLRNSLLAFDSLFILLAFRSASFIQFIVPDTLLETQKKEQKRRRRKKLTSAFFQS